MRSKPTILIFSLAYIPFVGGAELALKEITDRLPDYTFHLITYRFERAWPKKEKIGNIEVFRVGWGKTGGSYYGRIFEKFLFIPLAFLKAFFLHRAYSYKIFWSLMASRASAPALFMKFLYPKIPFFLTIQEGDTPGYARKRAGIFYRIWKRVFSEADYIQVISSYLKNFCVQNGASEKRVTVVPNGIDEAVFSPERFSDSDKRLLRKKLGILSDEKVIITASRLVPKNGVDILLGAIRILQKSFPKIKVLILGSGPEEARLRTYAATHNIPVLFLGEIAHEETPRFLAISDVFVRPSRSEGLGSAFLEAMAMNIPVVATPVGGIPDFLKDGETGLFTKVNDPADCAEKIKSLLTKKNFSHTLIVKAKQAIEKSYQWKIIAGQMELILKKLLRIKKRILVVSGIFSPDIGGSATYSGILLKELPRRGFFVSVLTFGNALRTDIDFSIIRISRRYWKGIRHFLFFAACFWHGRRADIILSADASMGGGLTSRTAALLLRKPFLVRVTGEYAWEQGYARFSVPDLLDEFQKKKYSLPVEIMRFLEHWIVKGATQVFAPSYYLAKIISGWGITPKKISIIFNGNPNTSEIKFSKREVRKKLNIPKESYILLSAGRLVPWKGFSYLIKSMPAILHSVPQVKLYIAGDGAEKKNLELEIRNANFSSSVYLLGALSQETLFLYMQAADLFILNSAYEGFPHILVEALQAGAVVIATDVGGTREIITNGQNGLLVPYGDSEALQKAVFQIISDQHQARLFSKMGRKKASEFTVEKMIDALTNVIRKIL